MELYKDNKKFQKVMDSTVSDTDHRGFTSFMITPVQIGPRYGLHIMDLRKVTPSSHPDAELLEVALEKLQAVNRGADQGMAVCTHQARLLRLRRKLSNDFGFLAKGRRPVAKQPIKIERKDGAIWLFRDLVMVIRKTGVRRMTVVYHGGVAVFRYFAQWPEPGFVTIDADGRPLTFRTHGRPFFFDSGHAPDADFFQALEELQTELVRATGKSEWVMGTSRMIATSLVAFAKPRVVRVGADFFIFNDRSAKILRLRDDKLEEAGTLRQPARDVAVTSFQGSVVIFSGNELLRYDPVTEQTTDIPLREPIEPRRGASLVAYKDDVIIFGGKAMSRQQYFDDVVVVHVPDGIMELVAAKNSPSGRWCHAAVVIGDKMFIAGGADKTGALGGLWEFNIARRTWARRQNLAAEKRGLLFGLRRGLAALTRKSEWLFAGSLDVMTFQKIDVFGNVPDCSYAAVVPDADTVHVFAGWGRHSKLKEVAGLYVLKVSLNDPLSPFLLLRETQQDLHREQSVRELERLVREQQAAELEQFFLGCIARQKQHYMYAYWLVRPDRCPAFPNAPGWSHADDDVPSFEVLAERLPDVTDPDVIDWLTFSTLPSYCSYFLTQAGSERFVRVMRDVAEDKPKLFSAFARAAFVSPFFLAFAAGEKWASMPTFVSEIMDVANDPQELLSDGLAIASMAVGKVRELGSQEASGEFLPVLTHEDRTNAGFPSVFRLVMLSTLDLAALGFDQQEYRLGVYGRRDLEAAQLEQQTAFGSKPEVQLRHLLQAADPVPVLKREIGQSVREFFIAYLVRRGPIETYIRREEDFRAFDANAAVHWDKPASLMALMKRTAFQREDLPGLTKAMAAIRQKLEKINTATAGIRNRTEELFLSRGKFLE
jgi:hypothetical protein